MNFQLSLFRYLLAPLIACSLVLHVSAKSDKELQAIDPPADLVIPPAPALPPEEALKTFTLEEGFEIQLVASEPLIHDPVCMAWDEHGRIWVCEMSGYMRTLDAEGQTDPIGNIVILEDTDADGKMDKRTVFLDGIVLPRAIAFAKSGVLYADTTTLWFVRQNSDGSAGAKIPVDRNYANNGGKPGNVEHQANGLLYGLDNWYYNAKSSRRYAQIGSRFRRGSTEFRGQWGITQDDDGRLLANRNPIPIEYDLYFPSSTLRNPNYKFNLNPGIIRVDNKVYPIRVTPGTNRAYRPNQDVSHTTWKLQHATASCGPEIYRGAQFPDEYYGNVFVPEPAGNLVKRIIRSTDDQGKPTAKQAYAGKEFLASTDERSRMVNAYTGPDGALYLIDMYRGVIQDKHYLTSYLRRQAESRGLDKPIGMGRIYRVVHKDSPIDPAPVKLADLPSTELVKMLGFKNSWHRLNAQRLLVQRRDSEVQVALETMATTDPNPQARIHALWTLKGMRSLSAGVLYKAGDATDSRVRVQVLRIAEDYSGKTEAALFVQLMQRYNKSSPDWPLDLQLAFTAGSLAGIDTPEAYDVLAAVMARRGGQALFRSAAISGLRGKEAVMLAKLGEAGNKDLKKGFTQALVKATENGDLTIVSLLALIDRPDFKDSRTDLLSSLTMQAVEQQRNDVIDQLIDKLAADNAAVEDQSAILSAMAQAKEINGSPIELNGKPAIFETWSAAPPEHLKDLVANLDKVFVYEREYISPEMKKRLALGQLHFETHCSTCHGADGMGVEKAAPPLVNSNWVQKHPKVLATLVLNGVEGDIEVKGKVYTSPEDTPGLMPGLKAALTNDQDLADILTFIRSKEFKNNKEGVGPVDVQTVSEVRKASANRNSAHSVNELIRLNAAITGVDVISASSNSQVVTANWLNHSNRNLVITLFGVIAPLVLLLIVTVFGGMAKETE